MRRPVTKYVVESEDGALRAEFVTTEPLSEYQHAILVEELRAARETKSDLSPLSTIRWALAATEVRTGCETLRAVLDDAETIKF